MEAGKRAVSGPAPCEVPLSCLPIPGPSALVFVPVTRVHSSAQPPLAPSCPTFLSPAWTSGLSYPEAPASGDCSRPSRPPPAAPAARRAPRSSSSSAPAAPGPTGERDDLRVWVGGSPRPKFQPWVGSQAGVAGVDCCRRDGAGPGNLGDRRPGRRSDEHRQGQRETEGQNCRRGVQTDS